jgi:tRNA/rRNA methyltransferase
MPPLQPVIILCEPQLGENIGAAARAMANFGLSDLRLVNPRDGWPNERANANSARAMHVIDAVRVFDTVEEAIADLTLLYATTARPRDMAKRVVGPVSAVEEMRIHRRDRRAPFGLLFGRERWGLNNDEIALCDAILTLPVDERHASLNIAQAVIVIAYEWTRQNLDQPDETPFMEPERAPPASREDLLRMFEHLEGALERKGFFYPPEKRELMIRNLRNIFLKGPLNEQEVRTMRGVIAAFERDN